MTRENPSSIYKLVKYLSEKTGIPAYEKIVIENQSEAGYSSRIVRVLDGKVLPQLVKIQRKGGIDMLTDLETKTLNIPIDTEFDEVYYMQLRDFNSFGVEVHKAGKYNMSEGGGWYVKKQLYEVDGKYFTNW